jgi:hypothetical protein
MANGFLLLGSVFLYRYFIEPVSLYMSGGDDSEAGMVTSVSVWSFYHLLWLLPIWGLCYVVSLGCYQSIADEVHRLQQKELLHNQRESRSSKSSATADAPPVGVKRSISGSVYAVLVWLLMFMQMRVFDLMLPVLLSQSALFVDTALNSLSLPSAALQLATLAFVKPLILASQGCRLFGLVLGSIVYGWYGFDLCWIAKGQDPERRFRSVEDNWMYFCGFGLPYVLLLRSTSFFLGYGLYLILFPFTLMLGAESDWQRAPQGGTGQLTFRVFGPSQRLALRVIKAVDRYLRPSAATRKKTR